jgi:hypothetical protein
MGSYVEFVRTAESVTSSKSVNFSTQVQVTEFNGATMERRLSNVKEHEDIVYDEDYDTDEVF